MLNVWLFDKFHYLMVNVAGEFLSIFDDSSIASRDDAE